MGTDDDPQPITQNLQPDVVDLLASLADKSLIRLSADGDDAPRVAMLETIRDFGAERLAASGEAHAVARRHAESFLAVAEEAAQYLEGPEQRDWLERLERDHPNLRAALAWLRDHGDAEATLRLGSALWRFWWLRGHFTEGRQQLDSLLRMPAPAGSTADRARVLNAAGVLAECQGDCDQAEALHEESLALFRRLDDRRGIASALDNLGVVAVDRGQYERAESLLEESLAIARDLDDAWMIATVVTDLGNIAAYRRDHQRAVDFYRAGLDLFRQVGDGGQVAKSLNNLGVATVEGGFDGAEELFNEALLLLREGGDKQGMTQALNNLATVALDADDLDRATALYHESLALARETGDKLAIAIAVQNLAELADRRGEAERSQGLYREALALYRTVGDWQGAADCLAGLAKVAETQGLPALTVRLFAAAASVRSVHDLSSPVGGDDERRLDAARQALGTEAFDRHWLVGQTSSFDQLVAEFGAPDRSGHRMQAAVR